LYRLEPELGSQVQVLQEISGINLSEDLASAPRNGERGTTRLDMMGKVEVKKHS